ncbi:MAG: hypothetical protein ACXW30_03585 [Micavibrio sp.]
MIRQILLCAALLMSFQVMTPVMAQDTAQPEKPVLVWPDPTPEELAVLPKDGCKELDYIKPLDPNVAPRAEYLAWEQSADGICYAWYKKRMDEAYVFGDIPPSGAPSYVHRLDEDQLKARALRAQIHKSHAIAREKGSTSAPMVK